MFLEGVHGYTPELADQRGIFFARGPAFKRGHMHSGIRMVDVYQIFAKVLDIQPLPNDGVWENVAGLFAEKETVD
ncbi:unnamed protein product [Allacma fusca]|uniref:Uncharacterized protein n=1 Tax=Allacma fusca TaxID=39272 RepID=A0A8J2PMI4_9HEXA|nr:unnamed protein product [Allacma fusca]